MVGIISKMIAKAVSTVEYQLPLGDARVGLNPYLGKAIALRFTGKIECQGCGRLIKKSFNQGFCFPCTQRLARCDLCILKPELCHYHKGTCREPEWGDAHCMIPHIVYLAVTSGVKVGITRKTQMPTRWLDQGASLALPLFEVPTRRISGYVEDVFRPYIDDKTNWRALLKQANPILNLQETAESLLPKIEKNLNNLKMTFGDNAMMLLNEAVQTFDYPILEYPNKIQSLSFDKQALIEGTLLGIKGQYLILDSGVLNIRKFTGYEIDWDVSS